MVSLASLWLPSLVSALFVFVASSIIHMAPLWHQNDYRGVPQEAELAGALRALKLSAGEYFVPWAPPRERRSPEFQQRMADGPVALVSVLSNGPVVMARPLALWFLYLLIVGAFSGLIAGHVLGAGTTYPRVFKVVLTAAFMGYALGLPQNSIWLRRPWSSTFKGCIDGLIYAGLTAGTFGWLWPHAT
jgi:hypothetical protein